MTLIRKKIMSCYAKKNGNRSNCQKDSWIRLELDNLLNPGAELGDPGVHAGLVLLGAPDAPADHTRQLVAPVLHPHGHGASRVSLEAN